MLVVDARPATAAAPVGQGWWSRLNDGATAAVAQPPPDVPEDGLYVAGGPDGPQAIAALAYDLAAGETPERLTMRLTGGGAQGLLAACRVVDGPVVPAQNGPWADAPTYDDATCVGGSADEDGVVTFEVAALAGSTPFEIAIVPTGPAVRAVFESPGQDSLSTSETAVAAPGPSTDPAPAVGDPVNASDSRPLDGLRPPAPAPALPSPAEPEATDALAGAVDDVPARAVAVGASDSAPSWYGTVGGIIGGALLFGLLLFYSLGYGPLGARYDT